MYFVGQDIESYSLTHFLGIIIFWFVNLYRFHLKLFQTSCDTLPQTVFCNMANSVCRYILLSVIFYHFSLDTGLVSYQYVCIVKCAM